MKYIVKFNGTYLNCFKTYSEAHELVEELYRVHRWVATIEVAE